MKFGWMTVGDHKKAVEAKENEIAELKKKLDGNAEAAHSELQTRLTALFGDEAKEEGFDLEARIKETLNYAAGLEKDLEARDQELKKTENAVTAATERLNAAAKVLGHESAEGVDLAAEISEIEPEGKTNPKSGKKHGVKDPDSDEFRCEVDDWMDAELSKLGMN